MAKRKRRSRSAVVSADTVRAIKARKRSFLSDVSSLLSDALGFAVRVSMVPPKAAPLPVARRPSAPRPFSILDGPLPPGLLGDSDEG